MKLIGCQKRIVITICLVAAAVLSPLVPAIATEVSVRAFVDRTEIKQHESIELTIEIKGDVGTLPALQLPDIKGFQVYSSGSKQNYSFINGAVEYSRQFNFALAPITSGIFTIPQMTVVIDGKKYTTDVITVTVSKSSVQSRSSQPTVNQRGKQPSKRGLDSDDLFIRASVDEDTVYVNEQVTLSLKIYQGVNILRQENFRKPQTTGFWTEDLSPQTQAYQTVNDRDYKTTVMKTALFPTAPGEHTIGAGALDVVVERQRRRDPFSISVDPFSTFFGRGERVTLRSDPVKVVALPLPVEGKPADFSGAVGAYSIKSNVDRTTVEVNEPITMSIRISGSGNIKTISSPQVPELSDFRTYQSGDSQKLTKANYRVAGNKTFEHVFVPKRAGNYMLPRVFFSFFDPKVKQYKTVSTEPVQVEVKPAKDSYVSQVQHLNGQQIDLVAKDIRYLKSDIGELNGSETRLLGVNPGFLLLYLVPLIGYLIVVGQQRQKEKLASDTGLRRLKQAKKFAEKRLGKAMKLLQSGESASFYSEISRATIQYFADRFNLPTFGLTADRIKDFAAGRLPDDLTRQLTDLLQECDLGRFAPGSVTSEKMEKVWNSAAKLIVDLERSR